MGVTLDVYRMRIGAHASVYINRFKAKQKKLSVQYNPYTKWDDVHCRSAAALILIIMVLSTLLCVLHLHGFVVNTLATSDDIQLCPVDNSHADVHTGIFCQLQSTRSDSGQTPCLKIQTGYYYYKRLIMLSADVELNPGPTNDMEVILQVIKEANEKTSIEIQQVKQGIESIQSDITSVKCELKAIKLVYAT